MATPRRRRAASTHTLWMASRSAGRCGRVRSGQIKYSLSSSSRASAQARGAAATSCCPGGSCAQPRRTSIWLVRAHRFMG